MEERGEGSNGGEEEEEGYEGELWRREWSYAGEEGKPKSIMHSKIG